MARTTVSSSRPIVLVESTSYPRRPQRQFDYLPPADSTVPLQVGQLVSIPFGREQVVGVIRQLDAASSAPISKLKTIASVIDPTPLPTHLLQLADWLGDYYQASPQAIWQTILPSALTQKSRLKPAAPSEPHAAIDHVAQALNPSQTKVVQAILATPQTPHLIHGITGSGKTRIYEALIEKTLSAGQSALILAPEIILTQHLAERLDRRFGDQLVMAHSGLTTAHRREIWRHCLHSTTPTVYLGPRSSLFLPINQLGLIIIDEEHDASYKQEQSPRYQASHVAARLHQLTQAQLILGSATPALTTLALAKHGNIIQHDLPERFGAAELPTVRLIAHRNRDGIISPALSQALQHTLAQRGQAIIMINRRGTARRLSCDDCGETVRCTYCDTPLVFHADAGRLRCHICGRDSWPPSKCPTCHSTELHYHGVGSKRVTEEINRLIPQARTGRLDRDVDSDGATQLIADMQAHKLDILVGTQMIAKGLDFPQVTLVGILNADDLIAGTDWMAAERAVSLIMQAAGRSGRATQAGQVIIQTHRPDQPIYQLIKNHDWYGFAASELTHRQKFGYPPYRWLLRLSLRRAHATTAEAKATELVKQLAEDPAAAKYEVLGPAVPLLARTGQWHYIQLVVKARRRQDLIELCQSLEADWTIDLDPNQIL